MRFLKNVCHGTLVDRWTNEQVRDRYGGQMDLFGKVKSNTLRWIVHVERMEC